MGKAKKKSPSVDFLTHHSIIPIFQYSVFFKESPDEENDQLYPKR